jgi:hypothetical protein
MCEKWRAVPGFEGLYAVSDQGRVKRLAREIAMTNGRRRISERQLARNPGSFGHWVVILSNGNTRTIMRIADLVMLAFEGPAPAGMEALHKDGDRANNRIDNLIYGPSRNEDHYFNPGNSKLVPSMVRDIRASNESAIALAKKYNLKPETIRAIKANKTWKDVK